MIFYSKRIKIEKKDFLLFFLDGGRQKWSINLRTKICVLLLEGRKMNK